MITIISSPTGVCLQGQPVIFRVTSNQFDKPFFKVMAEPVAGQSELLSLNSDDECYFDLREYFLPELSVSFSTSAQVHADACKQFEVVISEYYGNPPKKEATDSNTITVLRGTVPDWKQAEFMSNYPTGFTGWLTANIFLTWYPASLKKIVLPIQPEVLYFIAPSSASYSPSVVITYTDGTTATHSPAISVSAQQYQVASIPVGYTALGLAAVAPSKKVTSYTVTVSGKTRSYVVDYKAYRDVRYLAFRNSLGGYDVLQCTGEVDSCELLSNLYL